MCLAIPGQLKAFVDGQADLAVVDVGGVRRRVNMALLDGALLKVGDWVLLHVGFAMSRIGEAEAQEQLDLLARLGELPAALEEVHGYTS